jgi:hypothetical protein
MKTTNTKLTAEMVLTAARAVPHAGNDTERAYIYDVLVHLIEVVGVWATGEELRAELVSLHRAGKITLTRCDLVAAFDAEKIGPDGTCTYLSAEWQFICR